MHKVTFSRSISRLPNLPTIAEKPSVFVQEEGRTLKAFQSVLLDACFTICAHIVFVSSAIGIIRNVDVQPYTVCVASAAT